MYEFSVSEFLSPFRHMPGDYVSMNIYLEHVF
jgi:hypothetical protein